MQDLNVFTDVNSIQNWLRSIQGDSKVSFVATMGALHHGHLTLVEKAFSISDVVIVSIFVNPTQFNKEEDLVKYPRDLEADLELLSTAGDVVVFAPSVETMYPDGFRAPNVDLGLLDKVLEGEFRPGHFKGVMNIVNRFFGILNPDFALFGLKDFQQLAVIEHMVRTLELEVEIVPCETAREESGLASSSRNKRLTEEQKESAVIIIKTMNKAKELALKLPPNEVKEAAIAFFNRGELELEYLEIVNPSTFEVLDNWMPGARICISAYCAGVRLIDNAEIK